MPRESGRVSRARAPPRVRRHCLVRPRLLQHSEVANIETAARLRADDVASWRGAGLFRPRFPGAGSDRYGARSSRRCDRPRHSGHRRRCRRVVRSRHSATAVGRGDGDLSSACSVAPVPYCTCRRQLERGREGTHEPASPATTSSWCSNRVTRAARLGGSRVIAEQVYCDQQHDKTPRVGPP